MKLSPIGKRCMRFVYASGVRWILNSILNKRLDLAAGAALSQTGRLAQVVLALQVKAETRWQKK